MKAQWKNHRRTIEEPWKSHGSIHRNTKEAPLRWTHYTNFGRPWKSQGSTTKIPCKQMETPCEYHASPWKSDGSPMEVHSPWKPHGISTILWKFHGGIIEALPKCNTSMQAPCDNHGSTMMPRVLIHGSPMKVRAVYRYLCFSVYRMIRYIFYIGKSSRYLQLDI